MFWHFRITIFKTNYNFPVFLLIDSILKYTGSFVTMFLRWHCFDRCFIATDVAYVVKSALLTPFAKFTVFEKIVKMSHLISIAKLKNETFLDIQYTVEKWWFTMKDKAAVGWFPEIAIQQLYFSFVNLEISLTFRHWWWNTRFLQNKWQ